MSTPGGAPERTPSTVSTDKKPGAGKPPAGGAKAAAAKAGTKPTGRPGAARPGAGKGGKGKKPIAAVKATGGRNWGPIGVIAAVLLIAGGIIGYATYASIKGPKSFADRAADIAGLVNYRDNADKTISARGHKAGPLTYTTNPPVGGDHNPRWQNCMGDVYDAPIAKEHAVHSLEHGAVWVTYKLGTPADQVAKLAEKVTGTDFVLMSPVEGLDRNVSLQAWGYQLKLDTVDDKRIDEFIATMRIQAGVEPGATCSQGVTATGLTPQDAPAGG